MPNDLPVVSLFILLLGVEGDHPQLAHHNIFFSGDYRKEFQQIYRDGRHPDDPTIYVSITSKNDAQHAPEGCENWFILINAPAFDHRYDWQVETAGYSELVLARLAEKGFDIRGRLKTKHIITPVDIERMTGARRGALYGTAFNDRLGHSSGRGTAARRSRGCTMWGEQLIPGEGSRWSCCLGRWSLI